MYEIDQRSSWYCYIDSDIMLFRACTIESYKMMKYVDEVHFYFFISHCVTMVPVPWY